MQIWQVRVQITRNPTAIDQCWILTTAETPEDALANIQTYARTERELSPQFALLVMGDPIPQHREDKPKNWWQRFGQRLTGKEVQQ